MGWRGQHERDLASQAERRNLPLSQRYAWDRIVIALVFVGAALRWHFG